MVVFSDSITPPDPRLTRIIDGLLLNVDYRDAIRVALACAECVAGPPPSALSLTLAVESRSVSQEARPAAAQL